MLHYMLPEGNTLSTCHYEVKKILCSMGMEYHKIHACPIDCILCKKEFKTLTKCPRCGVSYTKWRMMTMMKIIWRKGRPTKVLWYLPIIPQFKFLFANVNDAKNLKWHENGRKSDILLWHTADSPQWKKIDTIYPINLGVIQEIWGLVLQLNGMNPYGNCHNRNRDGITNQK